MALVSVVTPVYNGERFLEECIRSVLAQSFQDWEYVIFDNGSTDRTPQIIKDFSADSRIRVVVSPRTLPVGESFNRAAGLPSPETRYLKFVCADDILFPACLELMVGVAEAHPDVRLVGSYKIEGDRAIVDGPPYPQDVVDGREVCRWFFQGRRGILGSETSHLLRLPAPLVDGKLFDTRFPKHSDTELFVRLLRDGGSFGFVHQVLTFTREHPSSVSVTQSRVMGTGLLEYQAIIRMHGAHFLAPRDLRAITREQKRDYRYYIFRSLLSPHWRKIRDYHVSYWAVQGVKMGLMRLAGTALAGAAVLVTRPADALRRVRRKLKGSSGQPGHGSVRDRFQRSRRRSM